MMRLQHRAAMPGISTERNVLGQQNAEVEGFFELFVFDTIIDQLLEDLGIKESTLLILILAARGAVFFIAPEFFLEVLFPSLALFFVAKRILAAITELIEIVEDVHTLKGVMVKTDPQPTTVANAPGRLPVSRPMGNYELFT